LITCEVEMAKVLGNLCQVATPFDYLLPLEGGLVRQVESVIDFSLTMAEVRGASAESVFLGSLLYCCYEKKVSSSYYSLIEKSTFQWE
jgi:hypothetical protein